MRNLFRNPLIWMILGECAVVAALILVAWHWIAVAHVQQSADAPVSLPAVAQDPTAQASPVVPKPPKSNSRQLPGSASTRRSGG